MFYKHTLSAPKPFYSILSLLSESPLLRIRSISLSLFLYKQTLSSFHKPYPFFLSLSLAFAFIAQRFQIPNFVSISDLNLLHMAMSDGTKMNLPDDLFSSKLTDSSHSSLKGKFNSIRSIHSNSYFNQFRDSIRFFRVS